MSYARSFLMALLFGTVLTAEAMAHGSSVAVRYLEKQARTIFLEGDRIKGEANHMRLESARLRREAAGLRIKASLLDQQWRYARSVNVDRYSDYPGRDRSQQIMRSDADREERDAVDLVKVGEKLDNEAVRLWQLAAQVDPQMSNALLKRMQACCKKGSIEFLKSEIVRLARQVGVSYSPGP